MGLEASGGGLDREGEEAGSTPAGEPADKVQVFEERELGVAADRLEGLSRHELRLVAERPAGQARAQVHDRRAQGEDGASGREADPKATALGAGIDRRGDRLEGAGWQRGVRVQEEQDRRDAGRRTAVELGATPRCSFDDASAEPPSERDSAVPRATVRDHDLGSFAEGRQQPSERMLLREGGYDHRDRRRT